MKAIKFFSMAALVVLGAIFSSCAKIDKGVEPLAEGNGVVYTTTINMGTDGTKALSPIGVKTFAEGDQIAVIYKNTSNQTVKAVSAAISSGVGTASATFEVTLTNPDNTQGVCYIYPAAMARSTIAPSTPINISNESNLVSYTRLNTQDGSLTTLGSNLDLCTYYADNWSTGTLPNGTLENKFAVLAINLNDGSDITSSITGLTLNDGTKTYTVSRSAAVGPIYVAIQPMSSATLNVTATDGTYEYVKRLTGKTYVANNGYNVTWNMAKITSKVTWNNSNVFVSANQNNKVNKSNKSRTFEGITITLTGNQGADTFTPYDMMSHKASFQVRGDQGSYFTFTAPSGKQFAKIEITATGGGQKAFGDWLTTSPSSPQIFWIGTPSNTVNFNPTSNFVIGDLASIVFYLK